MKLVTLKVEWMLLNDDVLSPLFETELHIWAVSPPPLLLLFKSILMSEISHIMSTHLFK